jgi:hypothetical protein
MARIPPYLLSIAGEYRVCSELNKRGVFATVTYGNRKQVDVYAISDRNERALKIEVKTSQRKNFVTGITQKELADSADAPDFWVLFQILRESDGKFKERFFVLSHVEICDAQKERNRLFDDKYFAKHGSHYDMSEGVDSVLVENVEKLHEDKWEKIVERIGGIATE